MLATALAFALYARVEPAWVPLGFVGLVPWLSVLDRPATIRQTIADGVLMSVAFVLAVFAWFAPAIHAYTGLPVGLAFVLLAIGAPLLQPQLVTHALARRLAGPEHWRAAVVAACVYVGTEWAAGKLFGDTLGHGLHASAWMRQAADLGGAHGLTFVLLLANECVRAVWVRGFGRATMVPAACAAALVVTLLAYGAVRTRQLAAAPDEPPVTAAIVQANIGQYERLRAELGTFEAVRAILSAHFALSTAARQRGPLDVLIWPETVYPTTFGVPKSEDGAAYDREIEAFVTEGGIPLVFGAYDAADGQEFNAAVFLEPATDGRRSFGIYRKATLFPLTERVPALLDSATLRRWLPWLGTWKPGTGPAVVPLALADGRTLRVAPLICYDAVDPRRALAGVRRGAELIMTLSNDSWFAIGGGPRLHLIVSAFRSIETRRPQLRATNTGISAVVTATGEIAATAGVGVQAVLVAAVRPERHAATLMLAWGDWVGPAALVTAALLLATTAVAHALASGRLPR